MKTGTALEMAKYSKVQEESSHGGAFSIEDEDDVEIAQTEVSGSDSSFSAAPPHQSDHQPFSSTSASASQSLGSCSSVGSIWTTLTFSWMQPLLTLGNTKPLDLDDLYQLPDSDRADMIYKRFKKFWNQQLRQSLHPSLAWAFAHSFGRPFFAAAVLKLIHDSCLFLGPLLLNRVINFLKDRSQPLEVGLSYVVALFCANLVMSLCLRQYFWWCYRVGMNLRSAIVTSVYQKALVISAATMSRKTTGEISNLMSVDSSRLQDLTPYLHALWYSFFQIALALFFLWRQLGISCLSGMAVIVVAIPVTSKVSQHMKTLQKALSKIRDERIKLTNEVLSGMKVIKLQAWEQEFSQRILSVRREELATFRRYTLAQAFSGALFTTIPLLVAILTFATYIALGNHLDVATALTSLALFDLLRFPLFMLPNVINNVVEARVSIDRVESFLLEPERFPVPAYPLKQKGVLLHKATLVYDAALVKRYTALQASESTLAVPQTTRASGFMMQLSLLWRRLLGRDESQTPGINRNVVSNPITATKEEGSAKSSSQSSKGNSAVTVEVSEEQKRLMIQEALLKDAEERVSELEEQLLSYQPLCCVKHGDDPYLAALEEADHADHAMLGGGEDRLLTLSRLSLHARCGELTAVIGQVGSGKSSVIHALLGNLLLCHGRVALCGRVAYSSQLPFITNSTLKENILYGEPYNEEKYNHTLEMCALLPDIAILPGGDATEIGERGINLSGGQKARVGLARAVYADADIYLLDDPLSAVDAHVGQHLFDNCIMELLKRGKCIILVTNALQYVRYSSRILVLKDGRIAETGTFDDLLTNNTLFSEMMNTMQETMTTGASLTANNDDDSGKNGQEAASTSTGTDSLPKTVANKENEAVSKTTSNSAAPLASKPASGKLISTEEREVGDVDMKIYMKWATAAGGAMVGLIIIFNFYLGEAISVLSSWWLSYWSEHREDNSAWFYLGIYIVINAGVVMCALLKEIYCRLRSLDASRSLYEELLQAVLYAPMSFFDTTPLGRVINRFSKDIYTIDEQIPQTVRSYLATVAKVTGVLIYVCVVTPLFIIGLVPMAIFYFLAQKYYIRTSRELTRIESITRSPIYALFSETLDGLSTIRAYGVEQRLSTKNQNLLDANQRAYFLNFSANCWLAVRLEFVGTLIVTCATLFAVLARQYRTVPGPVNGQGDEHADAVFAGLAGLSISLALSVTQSLNWTVRMASDMESQMVSVERVKSYATMSQEKAHHLPTDPDIPMAAGPSWPREGAIVMQNVSMRYRPGLPLVLQGLTLAVEARQKVGIVGRTGAGKSSLLTALLRLVELEDGIISIDGVDISKIGLHALRAAMAVIPQDPVLFSGSIRSNLDPFGKYSDEAIWESINRCLLSSSVTSLEDKVHENGSNFSVGQRQLLCIARALLAKARVIIMDEATAAVDVETDALIQKTIRRDSNQ
eukprot:gene7900-8715_t